MASSYIASSASLLIRLHHRRTIPSPTLPAEEPSRTLTVQSRDFNRLTVAVSYTQLHFWKRRLQACFFLFYIRGSWTTRTMAFIEDFKYIMETMLGQKETSQMRKTCKREGIIDILDFITLNEEIICGLIFQDTPEELGQAYQALIRCFATFSV